MDQKPEREDGSEGGGVMGGNGEEVKRLEER